MNDKLASLKDQKTAAEHEEIILKYKKTRILDRKDAIDKYKKFNDDHPEYYIPTSTAYIVTGKAISIDDATDNVIVGNLCDQLMYLTGKNILEDKNNG